MVQSLQPTILVLIVLFPALSTTAVALRLYCRALLRQFHWDDGLVVLAWALAVGQATMIYLYCLRSYQGYHWYDVPDMTPEEMIQNSKYDLANQLLYNPILALVKASIIIFLWRLEDRRRVIQWALTSFFVFNILLTVSVFIADLCQCTPINYYWDHWVMDTYDKDNNVIEKGGHCIDQANFALISAGLSVLTDVMILLIPAAMVWNLRMPRKKKIAVWAVLSLGWIVAIIGIIRIALYYYRFRPDNIDRSYSVTITTSGMEVSIAIIASCGPALKALSTRYFPNLFGSQSATSRTTNVFYSPDGYARSKQQGYTRHHEQLTRFTSKGDRPEDAQYGMRDLGPAERETDGDSQEAIVKAESVQTKRDDFDCSTEDTLTEPDRAYYRHRPSA